MTEKLRDGLKKTIDDKLKSYISVLLDADDSKDGKVWVDRTYQAGKIAICENLQDAGFLHRAGPTHGNFGYEGYRITKHGKDLVQEIKAEKPELISEITKSRY